LGLQILQSLVFRRIADAFGTGMLGVVWKESHL
jgi:hypothetical protein